MDLITPEIRGRLLANGRATAAGEDIDPVPVVRLFTPDGKASWLLTEMDPADEDRLYGLCDLGQGAPECGDVRLSEILEIRGPLRLTVERDLAFKGEMPLSRYEVHAVDAGFVRR